MKTKKIFLILIIVAIFLTLHLLGLTQYLTLRSLQQNLGVLNSHLEANPLIFIASFFLTYVLATALSLPGATLLTLLAGALFGLAKGFLIVSFASTIGATIAFLITRFLFKDYVSQKFANVLKTINQGMQKDGSLYLFGLRLVPAFPFFVINLCMGLTNIPTKTFYIISQLGMIPGTLVYVNAGKELAHLNSLSGILSPSLILAFTLLGILPFITKFILNFLKNKRVYKGYKKPSQYDFNLVVIGGGSAGLVSAYIASAVKAKVALIEKHKMGGDCLNTGCVPSKALIRTARFLNEIKNSSALGVKSAQADFNFSDIMGRVHQVIKKIQPHDSIERYSNLGVECIAGNAKIISPWEVQIGDKILKTKNIAIATGARPFVPPIKGLTDTPYVTSDSLWELKNQPNNLLVVGGGPIGCELAQSFNALGTKVTILELSKQLMGKEDSDVAEFIEEQFRKEGVEVFKNIKIVEFKNKNQVVILKNNQEIILNFDLVLVATGRRANVSGFGLEDLGIELTPQGTIQVNENLQTKYPNIYACGDVAGPYQFTHAAAHQAWFVAVNALFGKFKKFKIDYTFLPWATFTSPEVARVGLSELDAKNQNIDFTVYRYGLDDLDRAIADGSDHGFIKVLTKPHTDKILGVTIVAEHASDMLPEFVTAMKHGLGLNKILGTIHAYPTMSEANKYVAGVWKKTSAPEKLLKYVQKFHQWSLKY